MRLAPIACFACFAALALRCGGGHGGGEAFSADGGSTADHHAADAALAAGDAAMGQDVEAIGPGCTDCDHDGYPAPIDCNDNDPTINPEAYDFIGDGIDNDCDGKIDDPVLHCETIAAMPPGAPTDFARAADLCAQKVPTNTGKPFDPIVKAAWGQVSGLGTGQTLWTSKTKMQQVNIVSSFGANQPQFGTTMFGLSNGPWGATNPRATPPLDPMGFNLLDACSDIPLNATDCEALTGNQSASHVSVQDWAELDLWIQVPVNASGLSFDFAFFSSEFNEWWDSSVNDAFFALVSSKEIDGANVARDKEGLGINVDSGFFQLCPVYPGPAGLQANAALQQCLGMNDPTGVTGALSGTGYDGAFVDPVSMDGGVPSDTIQTIEGDTFIYGGGSGWLTATFPVAPKEQFLIRIMIMDTFDGIKDSVVLVDHFAWQESAPTSTGVVRGPK